jgi:hypothetical protein
MVTKPLVTILDNLYYILLIRQRSAVKPILFNKSGINDLLHYKA